MYKIFKILFRDYITGGSTLTESKLIVIYTNQQQGLKYQSKSIL